MSLLNSQANEDAETGLIPSDWLACKLGDLVVKVGSGVTPKGGSESYLPNGVPLIRSQNVLWGRLSLSDVAYISADQHQRMSNSALRPFDVLLNITGASIGRCAVLPGNVGEGNVNQHVCIIRPADALLPSFLSQYLNSQFGQGQINKLQAGGNREGLNYQQVRGFSIGLPPLAEQEKIAAILTAVDDKLDVIARQIEATQTLKQGLMQTLFSRGVGTKDADGRWMAHAEFKDSPFGPIPSKWGVKTLGEVCDGELQTGPFGSQLHAHEYQDKGVPVLMPKDLVNCRANLETAAKVSQTRAEELGRHRLNRGDLLFSRRGDVARFALIDEKSEGALCGTGCLKAIPGKAHSPAYLAHLLQLDVVRTWLEQNAVGQTMPNMNTAILASLPLVVPDDRAEQERIAGILDSVDAKASLFNEKRASYQTLKRGLMQKLLTGEWRVKVDAEMAA
ncbi:restriction endonuclease subunit S [uncultured Pseudacidovorax sp.]|uniref:restriction endonuclease subunit S n=1 Tax=uncultured Pseudacidovorax sp. TaxID=679313 RepID=UPI0025FAA8A8|nr:restriction endonuclease subunit S [uncultured Pseudacidovorax sp.]